MMIFDSLTIFGLVSAIAVVAALYLLSQDAS